MNTAPPSHDFAARLRDALSARGISRKQFAGLVDVSQNTVTSWATGRYRPDHGNLVRIAAALGLTLDELHAAPVPAAPRATPPTGPRADASAGDESADAIIRQLAGLDLDGALRALHGAAPDLMQALSEARSYATRKRR
jgi:transcriptional regulator with XRE-family HTH domain